ncbi:hypothetical protein CRG98_019104 [Punica granatum]|uniref:Uncharacterized protein n=1 Tax=Punica granatum TaxID=22663 RepID=A0A2I0JX60_PUNGR|nr:hypothetical protein CRG98_019104 [Punica granatum]
MEMIGPEVRDWDEEDDDMEFEQSTQPGLEEIQCANATVEASQVRTKKKSVVVTKRKQKEKDVAADHDDTILASLASPPANVADDVEETPAMDERLSYGYKSEKLESLAGDSDEEKDKFPMCGEMGHTKRKCTGQPVAKGKKDRYGASISASAPSGSELAEAENLNVQVPQMPTFAEASFFQPMTAPPMRPPPVRPPLVRPPPVRPHHSTHHGSCKFWNYY